MAGRRHFNSKKRGFHLSISVFVTFQRILFFHFITGIYQVLVKGCLTDFPGVLLFLIFFIEVSGYLTAHCIRK